MDPRPRMCLKGSLKVTGSRVPVLIRWTRPTLLNRSVTLPFSSMFDCKSFWYLNPYTVLGFWVNYCKKCGERGELFKKCGDCGEKNNLPHFTAFRTKIHRAIHRISYKIHHIDFCGKLMQELRWMRWKKNSPNFLQKFTASALQRLLNLI